MINYPQIDSIGFSVTRNITDEKYVKIQNCYFAKTFGEQLHYYLFQVCTPTYFDAFSNVDEEQELTCPDDCTDPDQGKYIFIKLTTQF